MATVRRVLAPNPGPFTGPGTNTWIIDAGPVVVADHLGLAERFAALARVRLAR